MYVAIIISLSQQNANSEEQFDGTSFFSSLGLFEAEVSCSFMAFISFVSMIRKQPHQFRSCFNHSHEDTQGHVRLAALPVPEGIQLKDLLEHRDCHIVWM